MVRWTMVLGLAGCAGEPGAPVSVAPRTEAALIATERFVVSGSDPVSHGTVDCPVSGWGTEGATLEVDTGLCRYGVFEQPLLDDLVPADVVEVVFWHNQLVAPEPATGHLLLAIEGDVVFEVEVRIPAEPAAYTETFTGVQAQAGDLLQLHLHNHGANTWNLLHVDRLAED